MTQLDKLKDMAAPHNPMSAKALIDLLLRIVSLQSEALDSVAAVATGFDERLQRMKRGDLIAMIDTDLKVSREALAEVSKLIEGAE